MIPPLKTPGLSRRRLLQAGLAGGAVAWAGGAYWSGARAAERPRLAVLMMQGGLDGLSLAPPLKDARYQALRGALAVDAPLPFSADFGLHPALPELAAMAGAGQVRLAPAAASPGRSRSHFGEIEVLTSGMVRGSAADGGWLNRAVAALAPEGPVSAVSLDAVASTAVAGEALFGAWAPGAPAIGDLAQPLHTLYRDEPQLRALLSVASRTERLAAGAADGPPLPEVAVRARALGRMFRQEDGPVVGFISHGGFDTHQHQGGARGRLADRLSELDQALAALREGAGPAWARTVVVVFTEFGRTAAVNGSGGTDHGVASTALVLGGAVRSGGLIGDWPTLEPGRLYEGRDLAPTLDLYALFKGVLAEHWGLTRAQLESVFPASAARPLAGLIA